MKQIFELSLYGKMENYPQEKKVKLEEGPFIQKCPFDVLDALANPDI